MLRHARNAERTAHRAAAVFRPSPRTGSRRPISPCGVKRKIAEARDAVRGAGGDNCRMELAEEGKSLIEAARRLFAGRDGRVALTLVLAVTATLEASVYAKERNDLVPAILINVLAVLPLLAARRFPFLAAVASTGCTLVILASSKAPLTVTALGVLLYLIGNVVVRRGLVWALP